MCGPGDLREKPTMQNGVECLEKLCVDETIHIDY